MAGSTGTLSYTYSYSSIIASFRTDIERYKKQNPNLSTSLFLFSISQI